MIWRGLFQLPNKVKNHGLTDNSEYTGSTHLDLVRTCRVRLLKHLFRLIPRPPCEDLNTSPLLFPIVLTPGKRPSSFRVSTGFRWFPGFRKPKTKVVNLH